MTKDHARLDAAIADLPSRYPGPGGAVAVLHRGEVLVRHAWGYANAERRIAFTPQTLFRMCSITKQFTCSLALDLLGDVSALDNAVRRRLPNLMQAPPTALQLCHNQSGLRDYWAVAMLLGAPAESAFGDAEARRLIAGTRTLQFAPGMHYSYVNQNFRLLSDALEEHTGRGFAELLQARLFDRFGMNRAILAADTRALPDGTEGYEGTEATGFRPAENRVIWTGDAGLGASLDDMIAWERSIDSGRNDPDALYNRLSQPVTFADGAPARYGFGLAREVRFGRAVTGHGGALRGWRSHRLHVADARVSVVVLFNHMADARRAANDVLDALLDVGDAAAPSGHAPDTGLPGVYLEMETGLSARVSLTPEGRVGLRYLGGTEMLEVLSDGSAQSETARLAPSGSDLSMVRPGENRTTTLRRVEGSAASDIAGTYACAELEPELAATLTISSAGGILYGGFSGAFGLGRMERLQHLAGDVWVLPCPRALDVAPPGDWTLAFDRAPDGTVSGLRLGCWLARNLRYDRI